MPTFKMVRLQVASGLGLPNSSPMKLKPRQVWVSEANEVYSVPSLSLESLFQVTG
jgi:hypothetical protein